MTTFDYVITDPEGIHARPAGLLVKEAAKFQSTITLETVSYTHLKYAGKSIIKLSALSALIRSSIRKISTISSSIIR